jgi:SAM-dependent methyltransferase
LNDFFGELYLRSTRPFLDPERTRREVAYLRRVFDSGPGGPILDVGCGHGRHAGKLAETGLRVVGLEQDPLSLAEREPGFVPVRGDFRQPPFRAVFAGAYAWYSTLFDEDHLRNQRALAAAGACLVPGGQLLIHTVPRRWLTDNPRASFHRALPDGALLEEESTFEPATGCDRGRRTLRLPDGRVLQGGYCIRYYEPAELEPMAAAAGLRIAWVHGNLDGHPLEALSSVIVVGFVRLA